MHLWHQICSCKCSKNMKRCHISWTTFFSSTTLLLTKLYSFIQKVFLFRRQCSSDRPMLFVGSLCFLIGWGKRITISVWLQLSARLVFTCQFSPKTEFSSVWNWPILKQTHSTSIQHISPKSEHWVPKDATDRQHSFHVVREENWHHWNCICFS